MAVAASSDTHDLGQCDNCDAGKAGMWTGICSVAYGSGPAISPTTVILHLDLLPAEALAFFDSNISSRRIPAPLDPLEVPLRTVASEIGLTEEALYRAMAALAASGRIRRRGRRIDLKRV